MEWCFRCIYQSRLGRFLSVYIRLCWGGFSGVYIRVDRGGVGGLWEGFLLLSGVGCGLWFDHGVTEDFAFVVHKGGVLGGHLRGLAGPGKGMGLLGSFG